ncbi:MAG TPA: hypothetical protein VFB78_14555 [Acidimicrobiales bacterium]|nr:hypothetical protein [Acidimicrobiales bacterium]
MIVAYVPDLMDRSKVAAAGDVTFVTRPADLAAHGDATVIVDLSRPDVLDVLPTIGSARIIGFASHVDHDLMDAARAAGCTEVLPRSAFFGRLAELMR